ncbi:hypothetical protein H8E07_13355 [bacterium]|nr:hypothetical protein [bacterium]
MDAKTLERLRDVEHRQEGRRGVDEDDTRWPCSTAREQAERIDALMAFAARCQAAHATPGCEREPVNLAHLGRLAGRIEITADKREELEERVAELERLREFDTGSRELPKGVTLEHSRLDGMWQKMVKRIADLEQALEDRPPDADAALLASANRMLMERVERLEQVLDAARDVASGDYQMLHLLGELDDYDTAERAALRGNP